MFDEFFEVVLADTEHARKIHFNIRYQVYCEEMGFEDKQNCPEPYEKDKWDSNAVHFILRHRQSGAWVGAMRLIFHQNGRLPILEHCKIHKQANRDELARSVELSRLCVLKEVRRRCTDGIPPTGLAEQDSKAVSYLFNQRRLQNSLIWGLYRAASIYCKKRQIKTWYFLTTMALAKIVNRENFKFKLIGDCCRLNGDRFPFSINLDEVLANPLWSNDYAAGYKLYSELDSVALAA